MKSVDPIDIQRQTERPGGPLSITLTEVVRPHHGNVSGNMHGGEIAKLADSAAGALAFRYCGGHAVTRSISQADYLVPVRLGSLVRARATVSSQGRTSLRVAVTIETEGLYDAELADRGKVVVAAEFLFAMVFLDADGKPAPIIPTV